MGSFPSKNEEQVAIEEAATHYDFYRWANITLASLTIAGVLLNGAVLYVIFATPVLRRNTAMLLVAGLAFGDFMNGLWCAPHQSLQLFTGKLAGEVMPHEFHAYCQVFGWWLCFNLIASCLIFTLIAHERYVKVATPLRALQERTLTALYVACWATAGVLSGLNFWVGGYHVVPSGLYCITDFSQVGSLMLTAVSVMVPLGASTYLYSKIIRQLHALGRSRVDGHIATRTEAIIAMKMLVIMAAFVACWTPATIWMCWVALGLPNSDHPLFDIWSGIACSGTSFLAPLLNCMLFESLRAAVMKRLPFTAPFIKAITYAINATRVNVESIGGAITTMTGLDEERVVGPEEDEIYTGEYSCKMLMASLAKLTGSKALTPDQLLHEFQGEYVPAMEETAPGEFSDFVEELLVHLAIETRSSRGEVLSLGLTVRRAKNGLKRTLASTGSFSGSFSSRSSRSRRSTRVSPASEDGPTGRPQAAVKESKTSAREGQLLPVARPTGFATSNVNASQREGVRLPPLGHVPTFSVSSDAHPMTAGCDDAPGTAAEVPVDAILTVWSAALDSDAEATQMVKDFAAVTSPGFSHTPKGQLPPLIFQLIRYELVELAKLRRQAHAAQTKSLAIAAAFTTADIATDTAALVRLILYDRYNPTISYMACILGISSITQVFASLAFKEPIPVALSSLVGLKPLAQLYYRRLGFCDARKQAAEAYGLVIETLTESLPMLLLYTHRIMGNGVVDWLQFLAILSSLSTSSQHVATGCMVADSDHRFYTYYPEHYHLFFENKRRAKLGLRVCIFGTVALKAIAISALMSVSPPLCACWLIGEFLIVLAVRAFLSGEWRGYLPGTTSLPVSLALAGMAHGFIYMGGFTPYRLIIGPRLTAIFTAYGVAINVPMVLCAQAVGQQEFLVRIGHSTFDSPVWRMFAWFYVLTVVGWGLMGASIAPEKRKRFFASDTLKKYLDREWDTRTASRAGWGEGLDSARAHVVTSWSHVYWPKEKVEIWLNERWNVWISRPPKWFNARFRRKLAENAPKGFLPRAALRQIARNQAQESNGNGNGEVDAAGAPA